MASSGLFCSRRAEPCSKSKAALGSARDGCGDVARSSMVGADGKVNRASGAARARLEVVGASAMGADLVPPSKTGS